MQLRHLLVTIVLTYLIQLPGYALSDSEKLSLDVSSDLSRQEINGVLEIAKKQNAGKVISIIQQTEHSEKTYKVKVINSSGRLQTYFVNQSMTQMKP